MFTIGLIFVFGILLFLRRLAVQNRASPTKIIKTLAVMGSGGHTTEMIELLKVFDMPIYKTFVYVLANTDKLSRCKITELHSSRKHNDYKIEIIPRSREVGQSWLSAISTTIHSLFYSVPIVWRYKPDLILVNGPGTCVPIIFAAVCFNICGITNTLIIYEESICCVQRLSLSGKILYYTRTADEIIVQWPHIIEKYPRCKYIEDL